MSTPSTWYLPPQPTPRQTQRATRSCGTRPTDQVRRLRGSWRPAQAWATPRTQSSARLVDAEDYVDAVYMVLAAAARTPASAALCSATHACAGKTCPGWGGVHAKHKELQCTAGNFCMRVYGGPAPAGGGVRQVQGALWMFLRAEHKDPRCSRGEACAQVTPTQAQRLTRSVLRLACKQHQRAPCRRVFGQPVLAPCPRFAA